MGLTRADLIDPRVSDKDKAEIKVVLERYMQNDEWAKKALLPIAVLLTSHPANRAYLKASVESHKKLGYWLCLAYDNYIDPAVNHLDYNAIMPAKDVIDLVDTFIMPHHQTWGGVLYPYFWLLKFGINALQDFEYIYCTNGDFILEKPEGFQELFSLLGDADIMTSGPDYENAANTAGFIAKSSALRAIVKHVQDHFIPFEVYEKYTQELGNAEGRFGRAIKDLNLKQVKVEPPNDDMFKIPGKGTWYDLVGFRHIHSELNNAYRNRGIPPPSKHLDKRFTAEHDLKFIKLYEETNDIKVLEDWWIRI